MKKVEQEFSIINKNKKNIIVFVFCSFHRYYNNTSLQRKKIKAVDKDTAEHEKAKAQKYLLDDRREQSKN